MVKRYAGVAFRCSRRVYCFEIGALHLKVDDAVIVETDRGVNMGTVVVPPEQAELPPGVEEDAVKKVLRKAREDDFAKLEENRQREQEAARLCREKISGFGLQMKLVRAELMHDSNRVIFYFTAENRVDFRELVKELAHQLHVRVEMRQIGIRDAAGMIGGIGVCGRELCCAAFLSEFEPVTVKMAKEQNLALNPMKISGICGRLMCCLGYEYDNYRKDNKRNKPRRPRNPPAEEGKTGAPELAAENRRRESPASAKSLSEKPAAEKPVVVDPAPVKVANDEKTPVEKTAGEQGGAEKAPAGAEKTSRSRSSRRGRSGKSGNRGRSRRKKEQN